VRPEWSGLLLRPRLLKGLHGYRSSLRVRSVRLNLTVERCGRRDAGFEVDGKRFPYAEEGLCLPYPRSDIRVKVWVPPLTKRRKK
jgi:hypothetical protein